MSAVPDKARQVRMALQNAEGLLRDSPHLAAEQAQEILRVVPQQTDAELILALAQRGMGSSEIALSMLDVLLRRHPHAARLHVERGLTLDQLKRHSEALQAHRQAVKFDSRLAESWRAIADHCRAMDDEAGAEHAINQYLLHAHGDASVRDAAAALVDHRIPDAERLLRAHLFKHPTDVAAIRMMAELAARLGRYEDAEHLLLRALELAPNFDAARQNLAMVLHRSNQPEAALQQIECLLEKNPASPSLRNLKAVILCRIGDYNPAIELYEGILREYEAQPKLWLSYGHALKTAGRTQESIEAYRRCIGLDPQCGEAYWSLANLKTFRFTEADVTAMQNALANGVSDVEQRAQFEFALGKATEDQGQFETCFQHYQRGNAIRRAQVPYRASDATARVERSERLFTREYFDARKDFGCEARDPIFIVGLPRSGSTLIEQILASHSQVEGTMELPEIISITRELRQQAGPGEDAAYHEVLARLDANALRDLGQSYLDRTRVHRKAAKAFFIDKMPNNFFHVGLIHSILPNAKIIDARRHPLACCWSGFKQYFARGQNFSYGLSDLGHYYRDYVRLMAHFDEVLPGRVHRVIHEQLVDHTEAEVRRLLEYCGLPFEAACLRFFENTRPVRTASSEQVRRPINREGLEQFKSVEPWLGELKESLGEVLHAYPNSPIQLQFIDATKQQPKGEQNRESTTNKNSATLGTRAVGGGHLLGLARHGVRTRRR